MSLSLHTSAITSFSVRLLRLPLCPLKAHSALHCEDYLPCWHNVYVSLLAFWFIGMKGKLIVPFKVSDQWALQWLSVTEHSPHCSLPLTLAFTVSLVVSHTTTSGLCTKCLLLCWKFLKNFKGISSCCYLTQDWLLHPLPRAKHVKCIHCALYPPFSSPVLLLLLFQPTNSSLLFITDTLITKD